MANKRYVSEITNVFSQKTIKVKSLDVFEQRTVKNLDVFDQRTVENLDSASPHFFGPKIGRWRLSRTVVEHFDNVSSHDSARSMVEDEFKRLAETWERETQNMSSIQQKCSNQAYRKLLRLGLERGVDIITPFILKRYKKNGGDWFILLQELHMEDPVSSDVYGDMNAIKHAWLNWGRERASQNQRPATVLQGFPEAEPDAEFKF